VARTGKYKVMSVVGLMIGALGMFLMAGMGQDTDYITVVRNMVLIGLGLGPVMPVFTLTTQTAVRTDQIGVATSLTQFSRAMGATLGTAIFGALLVNRFEAGAHQALPPQVASLPPRSWPRSRIRWRCSIRRLPMPSAPCSCNCHRARRCTTR
jgi:MFS family permease